MLFGRLIAVMSLSAPRCWCQGAVPLLQKAQGHAPRQEAGTSPRAAAFQHLQGPAAGCQPRPLAKGTGIESSQGNEEAVKLHLTMKKLS